MLSTHHTLNVGMQSIMTNRIKDIDDLFTMFHDFEIVGLKLDSNMLTMEILIPWSEIWNIDDYKMTFLFNGCTSLKCQYDKRTSNILKKTENGGYHPSKEHLTTDPDEIVKLELDVQSHEFMKPDIFILHCNSSLSRGNHIGGIEYGRIELLASNYQIFDNEMNEMTLDKMKGWATDWWNSIQKMWDDQRNS